MFVVEAGKSFVIFQCGNIWNGHTSLIASETNPRVSLLPIVLLSSFLASPLGKISWVVLVSSDYDKFESDIGQKWFIISSILIILYPYIRYVALTSLAYLGFADPWLLIYEVNFSLEKNLSRDFHWSCNCNEKVFVYILNLPVVELFMSATVMIDENGTQLPRSGFFLTEVANTGENSQTLKKNSVSVQKKLINAVMHLNPFKLYSIITSKFFHS